MLHTGSAPANLPPWSAPDSIGYALWNRLTRYRLSPSATGVTISQNPTAIHDRHMSFLGALTAQPPGLASAAPRWRVDDMRIFRHASAPAVPVVVRAPWPISVSAAATADSARARLLLRGATVIRGHTVGLSRTASLGGEVSGMRRASGASAWAVVSAARPELSVSTRDVESRVMRRRTSPVMPLTTDATLASSTPLTTHGPLVSVPQLVAPTGVLRALSYNTGTSRRSSVVLRDASWAAPQPSSLPAVIDRRMAAATLMTDAHVIVAKGIATWSPVGSLRMICQPAPAGLARPAFNTGLLHRNDSLFTAASPRLANGALYLTDAPMIPVSRSMETGILQLLWNPIVTRQVVEEARVAAPSASIPMQSRLVVPPLELRDRSDEKPKRGVFRVVPRDVRVGRGEDTFSTVPQRSDLTLRVVSRRSSVAMPSFHSGAAGAQIHAAMPVVLARAESLGSAPYDRPDSALMPRLETLVDVGPRADTLARALPHDSAADADEIVERAWREVMTRLAIEQERRGFGRWS
jgi:hypothetical protein